MQGVLKWQGFAAVGSTLALAAGLAALTPGAIAAPVFHACGSHTVIIEVPTGEVGKPPTKFKDQIKEISAQGVSCAAAFKTVNAIFTNKTGKPVEGYKCAVVKFKVPAGLVPEQCTKSGKKIRFAAQGG